MIIRARNLLDQQAPITYLTNPEVAGTNALRWKNPSGFFSSWAVQVGKTSAQQSEIVLLGTAIPTGTAGTLTANTLYEHPSDTPLYAIKYDQIVFESSPTGTTGVASPITNGTVTITPDGTVTIFDDINGTPGITAYKTYFRNSVLNITTTESDWITSSGFSWYSLAKLRQRVKDRLYDASYIPNDLMIDDWINEWMEEMNAALIDINQDYSLGTVGVVFNDTQELGTITNADYRGLLKRAWYQDSSGTYPCQKMDSNTYSPNRVFSNTFPYYYLQGDNVIGRRPSDVTGTILLEYDVTYPLLVNDTDILPVPMRGYTTSFVDYGESVARRKDNKADVSAALFQKADAKKERFKSEVSTRMRTGATYSDIVEDTASEQEIFL